MRPRRNMRKLAAGSRMSHQTVNPQRGTLALALCSPDGLLLTTCVLRPLQMTRTFQRLAQRFSPFANVWSEWTCP
jgi:hypothetical protein